MESHESGVMLRVEGAGADVDVPPGWRAVDVSRESLAEVLDSLGDHRVVVIVPERAAADALPERGSHGVGDPVRGRPAMEEKDREPTPARHTDHAAGGWPAGLAALGGQLDTDAWPALPEGLARVAPVRNVLESAGQIGIVTRDEVAWVAFGFPDLRRPGSKVLLVREGDPQPEVIALHRHPQRVGTMVFGDSPWLPTADADPDPIAREHTGRPLDAWGTLFAVEPSRVYILRDGRVRSWDGRNERDVGTRSQALASLVLRWSQR